MSVAVIAEIKTIGLRISAIRNNMGLSQEKFAELLGISRNTMGSIERGETAPSTTTLITLFSKTDISPNCLFYIVNKSAVEDQLCDLLSTMTQEEKHDLLKFAKYISCSNRI